MIAENNGPKRPPNQIWRPQKSLSMLRIGILRLRPAIGQYVESGQQDY
jgi:hypothetical protein